MTSLWLADRFIPAVFCLGLLARLVILWLQPDRRWRVETWARSLIYLWGLRLAVWHLVVPPLTARAYESLFFLALLFTVEAVIESGQLHRGRRPRE